MTPETRLKIQTLFESEEVISYLAECTIATMLDARIDIDGVHTSSADTIRGLTRGALLLLTQILEKEE